MVLGDFMKNSVFSKVRLLAGAVLVASLLMLVGCKPAADDDPIPEDKTYYLSGTWKEEYGTYKIDCIKETFDAGEYSYAGNEMVIRFSDEKCTAGTIFIKYTKAYEETTDDKSDDPTWTYSDWTKSYYRYSTTAPDVGKWYAISFKDLTNKSISISGAYGTKASTDTLEEAVKEFTIENGYFSLYSECVRQ